MAPRAQIPDDLSDRPFSLADARRAGLSLRQLQGSSWVRVGTGEYARRGRPVDPIASLGLALERLPAGSRFAAGTAAWLHGLDVPIAPPFEAIVPPEGGVSARSGLVVRRVAVRRDEAAVARGLPVTSVSRTLADLAARLSLVEAVVLADAALHARLVTLRELQRWLALSAGRKGSRALRAVLEHAEPASESPMETRLRMLLVLSGLPRPQAQVSLRTVFGRSLARVDLYYPEARLCIEFDGGHHRDSLAADDRRQNRIVGAGYRLLRYTGEDVYRTPAAVVAETRAILTHSPADARIKRAG